MVHWNHTRWCSSLCPTGHLLYIPDTPYHAELRTHTHTHTPTTSVISRKKSSERNCIHRFPTLMVPRKIPGTRHADGGVGQTIGPTGIIVKHPFAHKACRSKENVFMSDFFFYPELAVCQSESKQIIEIWWVFCMCVFFI